MDSNWITIVFSAPFILLVCLQVLLVLPRTNKFVLMVLLRPLLRRFELQLEIKGGYFSLFLFGIFWARDIHLYFEDSRMGERYNIQGKEVYLFCPIWSWFRGRLAIAPVHLLGVVAKVEVFKNKDERARDMRPLPPIGSVVFREVTAKECHLFIEDKTLPGSPMVKVADINAVGGYYDFSVPMAVLLFTRRATANFDGAAVNIQSSNGDGRFKVDGLDLKSLVGLGSLLINTGVVNFDYQFVYANHLETDGNIDVKIMQFSSVFDTEFRSQMQLDELLALGENDRELWQEDRADFQSKLEALAGEDSEDFNRKIPLNLKLEHMIGDFDQSLSIFAQKVLSELAKQWIQPRIAGRVRLFWQKVKKMFQP